MRKNKRFNQYQDNDYLLEGGDAVPAEDPPKEDVKSEKPKSEKPKSEKSEKKEPVKEDDDPYAPPVLEECCCCECVCANEFTKGYTCCLCMPVKCGAVCIAVFTVIVTVILFLWYFFCFMNEYLHWWYTMICCFILIPLLVASAFCVSWFTNDSRTTRTMLFTSQILALVSTLLLCIWNLIYFIAIYKKDVFYSGMGDIDKNYYAKQSKKIFIFTMLAESVILITLFAYFTAVVSTYAELMHGPKDEEEEEKPEDDKEGDK